VNETLRLRLAGGKDAAVRARNAVDVLNSGIAGLRDVTRLLVSELVTNSVRHAEAREIELELIASPRGVRAQVTDPGPGFSPPKERKPSGDGGFGLYLVDQLSDRWGVDDRRPGRVWFEVDR
jgi:anti-sigma regulatory factor (Ser/Thr protein kinase)